MYIDVITDSHQLSDACSFSQTNPRSLANLRAKRSPSFYKKDEDSLSGPAVLCLFRKRPFTDLHFW